MEPWILRGRDAGRCANNTASMEEDGGSEQASKRWRNVRHALAGIVKTEHEKIVKWVRWSFEGVAHR